MSDDEKKAYNRKINSKIKEKKQDIKDAEGKKDKLEGENKYLVADNKKLDEKIDAANENIKIFDDMDRCRNMTTACNSALAAIEDARTNVSDSASCYSNNMAGEGKGAGKYNTVLSMIDNLKGKQNLGGFPTKITEFSTKLVDKAGDNNKIIGQLTKNQADCNAFITKANSKKKENEGKIKVNESDIRALQRTIHNLKNDISSLKSKLKE